MRKSFLSTAVLILAFSAGALLFLLWPRSDDGTATGAGTGPELAQGATRKIKAMLFYVSADGARLVPVERDVPFGEDTAEQARRIVEAQLASPPPEVASAIPPGTSLRALYVTDRGQAFVDLSREVTAAHPGGSVNEILTVYSIVEALTANLPAISTVQILVDGREVDTLAGHVDLRRPLSKSTMWLESAQPAVAARPAGASRP
jgi:spore germination protein GerM